MEFSKKQRASKTTPKAQMLYETQRNLWILSSGDLLAFKISTGNFPTNTWAFFNFVFFPSYLTSIIVMAFGTIGLGNYSHIIVSAI